MMSNRDLDQLVSELQFEIERGLIRQEWIQNEGPEKTLFAPLKLPRTVLKPRIRPLFRAISDDNDVERDAESALLKETSVCRILAILIYIRCDASVLHEFRRRFIFNSTITTRDSNLPLQLSTAHVLFGANLGAQFYNKQFIFCPVVLKEDEEVECKGEQQWCRLPFMNLEFLDRGSSGRVSKVTLPKGHYHFLRRGPNREPQVFAWKEFVQSDDPKKAYETERENLRIIKNSDFTHPNILLASGSLLRGSVYSLYFEAAEHNLEKYLASSDTAIPRDALGVHAFLRRFRGLIDALDFLHNKLVSADTSENLRFAHLDLKPTNILVFMQSNERPYEIWKIHDFGVSRVSKGRHREELKGLKRLLPMATTSSSSGTTTIRSGSFLAPETHVGKDSDMGKVKSASDVWSLGCILSLVISFLDDGPRSIEKFEQDRKTGAGAISDHFFVRNKRNNHVLNPGVKTWFEKLEKRFANSDEEVLLAIRNIIYLLKNRILLIKPEKRASSKLMEELFDDILSQLNAQPSVSRTKTIAIKRPFDKFRLLGSKEDKAPEEEPKQYQLSLPPGSRRSKFTNCGEYLAYFSPEAIAFYETSRIRDTPHTKTAKMCGFARAARIAQSPTGLEWVNFDIGSVYLAAFTDRDCFDCYVYPHSAREQKISPSEPPDLSHFHHFTFKDARSKIHKMALSPDNKFLVHVLKGFDQQFYIYLSRVDDMISWCRTLQNADEILTTASNSLSGSTHGSHSSASKTLSKGSIQSLGPPVLPWKHILLNRKTEVEVVHVQALQFSADSQLFTLSSELANINECHFYAWTTERGRYVNSITLERQGNIDTSQLWITAFTPLMPKLAILAVKFQRVLCQHGFMPEVPSWASAELNIQLLDVLPLSNSDDRCLFIGRERRRGGPVKALYVEIQKLKDKISKIEFQYTIDLECDDWVPGRDSAATLDDGHLFLISRVDGTGFVKTFVRPNAPRITSR